MPTDAEIKEAVSYYLGFQTGMQFAQMGGGPLQIDDIDQNTFFRAMTDGMKLAIDPSMEAKMQICLPIFTQKLAERNKALAEANAAKAKAFLEENGKKEGVTTTESGLQYKVLTPADGRKYDAEKDGERAEAYVTYEGRLLDGTVFDKSDNPIPMPINEVVPGFSEALKLMPIGSEWEIYLPSDLAYGEHGPDILGPNATLIFKLKLHDIKPKKGSPDNPIQLPPEMLQQLQEAGMQPL